MPAQPLAVIIPPPREERRSSKAEAEQERQRNAFITASGQLDCEVFAALCEYLHNQEAFHKQYRFWVEFTPRGYRMVQSGGAAGAVSAMVLSNNFGVFALAPRPGAPCACPIVSNAQALANRSIQRCQPCRRQHRYAGPTSRPFRWGSLAADGQHLVVSFDEVRRFICTIKPPMQMQNLSGDLQAGTS